MGDPKDDLLTTNTAMNPLPPVSVLICTRNRPQLLSRLVDSIMHGDDIPAEMVIIDDSDAPHAGLSATTTVTEFASRGCRLCYFWEHSRGLSRANNQAAAAATYDLLVFTQDDVVVAPSWLREIVTALLEAGERSVVTGQVNVGDTGQPGGWAPSTVTDEQPQTFEGRIGKDVLYAQNMALYRQALLEIGGFDVRLGPGTPFPSAEDNDFGFRLLEAGYKIIYVPRAVTSHLTWRTGKDYLPLNWSYGLGQGAFYAKYLSMRGSMRGSVRGSLRDRYILARFARDLRYYGLGPFRNVWRRPATAAGQVWKTAGMLAGAARWLLTYGKGPA